MIQRRDLLNLPLATVVGMVPAAASARTDPAAARLSMETAIGRSPYDDTRVWGHVDRHSVTPGETFDLMLSTGPALNHARGNIETFPDRRRCGRRPQAGLAQRARQRRPAAGADHGRRGRHRLDRLAGTDPDRRLDLGLLCARFRRCRRRAAQSERRLHRRHPDRPRSRHPVGAQLQYLAGLQRVGRLQPLCQRLHRHQRPDRLLRPALCARLLRVRLLHRHLSRGLRPAAWSQARLCHQLRSLARPDAGRALPTLRVGGHNEYWSLEEFQAVHHRIFDLGRNTIFMGANTAYWQIRYGDQNGAGADAFRGRQLVCFKSLDDPVRFRGDKTKSSDLITMRFRDEARWPETMLMGVAYQSWFSREVTPPIRFPYRVARTDLPFFAGTGYAVGDEIGDVVGYEIGDVVGYEIGDVVGYEIGDVVGYEIGDVVGYEWDNTDPNGDGARLWDAARSRIPALDRERIKVLFTGDPVDVDGKPGRAEAVHFESPAGAKVFNSGSIRWCLGLGAPGFVREPFRRLNSNLLDHMLA